MESNAFLSKEEEAPLKTCLICATRECIKSGKICKDVEKLLRKVTKQRPKWETLVDPHLLENYHSKGRVLVRGKNKKGKEEALYLSRGKRKAPLHEEE